jgi:hypothetical protein
MLLALFIYGYATGCYSSRKIERAACDSLAFRCISANRNPDHDTLASFRRRFAKEIEAAFVQVVRENPLSLFGKARRLRVYRRLVQSPLAILRHRLPFTCQLRKEVPLDDQARKRSTVH